MMFCVHDPNIVLMYPCFKIGCTFFKRCQRFCSCVYSSGACGGASRRGILALVLGVRLVVAAAGEKKE